MSLFSIIEGARVNNIICEETVGLFSSLKSRAPNATLLNMSSKIKCAKNKTINYLYGMTLADREITIKRSIRLARSMKLHNKASVAELQQDIVKRAQQKIEQRQKKIRRDIEKKIKEIAKGNQDFSTLDCSGDKAVMIKKIVRREVIERQINHVWYSEESKIDVVWKGRIIGVDNKTSRDPLLVILYLEPDSEDNEPVKTPISVYQLATDYYCGDMDFINVF